MIGPPLPLPRPKADVSIILDGSVAQTNYADQTLAVYRKLTERVSDSRPLKILKRSSSEVLLLLPSHPCLFIDFDHRFHSSCPCCCGRAPPRWPEGAYRPVGSRWYIHPSSFSRFPLGLSFLVPTSLAKYETTFACYSNSRIIHFVWDDASSICSMMKGPFSHILTFASS